MSSDWVDAKIIMLAMLSLKLTIRYVYLANFGLMDASLNL